MARLTPFEDRVPDVWAARTFAAPAILAEACVLAAAIALNWLIAASTPSTFFSWTSMLLFGWLNLFLARVQPRAAILLLPITITRMATMISLVAIEAGAYMPEVNREGAPGDAAASFVAFTAIMFLTFAIVVRMIERPMLAYARSDLLASMVRLLAWPVIAGCAIWGVLAALHGMNSGFPLLEGVDRFLYRRYYSSGLVLALLENKYLLGGLLGTIAFGAYTSRLGRYAATATLAGLTLLYLLFGDKFFTILTQLTFFAMPYLLRNSGRLTAMMARGLIPALALVTAGLALNLYIFSDYGRLPLERGAETLRDRVAEQGELWYVASRDYRRATNFDEGLWRRYAIVVADRNPAAAAFRNSVETYYFIDRYAPAKLAASFRSNQGWVQLTMGYEAMALVMFGFVGTAILMVIGGVLLAVGALYVERSLVSGFPVSMFFAVWTYLQIYFSVQQASAWTIAGPGQLKRFLLFFVIELILAAINRSEALRLRSAARPFGRSRQEPIQGVTA